LAQITIIRPRHAIEALRQRLVDARMKLATLVVEDEALLPFFKRIEDEIAQLDKDHGVLERARALAATANRQKATS
jgi:hypothetical protein